MEATNLYGAKIVVHPTVFLTLIPDKSEQEFDKTESTLLRIRDYADLLRTAAQKLDEIATNINGETHISFPRLPMKIVLSAPLDVIKRFEKDPNKIFPSVILKKMMVRNNCLRVASKRYFISVGIIRRIWKMALETEANRLIAHPKTLIVHPKTRTSQRFKIYGVSFTDFSLNLLCSAYLEGMRQFYYQHYLSEILQEIIEVGKRDGMRLNFNPDQDIDYRWLEMCAIHGLIAAPGRSRIVFLFPDKHAAHLYQDDLLYHNRSCHMDLRIYRKMANLLKDKLDKIG